MLRVKSAAIRKGNPDVSTCGGEINMWMWLCRKRELFRNRNEEDRKKYCEAKKMLRR